MKAYLRSSLTTMLLAVTVGACLFSSATWLKVSLLGLSLIVAVINLSVLLINRKEPET